MTNEYANIESAIFLKELIVLMEQNRLGSGGQADTQALVVFIEQHLNLDSEEYKQVLASAKTICFSADWNWESQFYDALHVFSYLNVSEDKPKYSSRLPFNGLVKIMPESNHGKAQEFTDGTIRFIEETNQLISTFNSGPFLDERIIESARRHLGGFGNIKTKTGALPLCESLIAIARVSGILIKNQFKESASKEHPFLLVGMDLSGIQQYIYNIIPRKAAKNLKGRSFYLQLLAENIQAGLLHATGASKYSTLYASGGGFYLLLPNNEQIRTLLDQFIHELENNMFEEFRDEVFAACAYAPAEQGDLNGAKLSAIWAKLAEKLGRKKQQRYRSLIVDQFDNFFTDAGEHGLNYQRDAITGHEIRDEAEQMDGNWVSKSTLRQTELGKKLKSADYWVSHDEPSSTSEAYRPAATGPWNLFLTESEYRKYVKNNQINMRVLRLNKPQFDEESSFYLYGGNDYPENKEGHPKTFEELAGVEPDSNLRKLGILRMDVDSLGALFRKGFSESLLCLPLYTELSRQLDRFFRGYLNTLWNEEQAQEYKGYQSFTQIIYSGGDDLFIVGRWDLLIAFAKEIRQSFQEFTANTSLGISGGLSIVNAKFPLLKAADMAAAAEKDAKNHSTNVKQKDSFTLLGYPLQWNNEYAFVEQEKNKLVRFIREKLIPQGIINRIQMLHNEAQIQQHKIHGVAAIWRMAYFVKRQINPKTEGEAASFLHFWKDAVASGQLSNLQESHYHPLELLLVIARWAELELRLED